MVLGVIPARGGSKSIPRKNIKLIAGKPLIAWTIEAAQESTLMDRFIVSTEDAEIAQIAKKYGAEVIDRPDELATDEASTISVLQHILLTINSDVVVLLQPTSPIRDKGLIDACIKKFQQNDSDNLATGFVCKYKEYGSYNQRRQDLNGFFYDDGNIYVIKSKLIKNGTLFGEKVQRIETTKEQNIEIDENFDFWLAEKILIKRYKQPRLK
jgi:CMP-N-acetylneuraminic acid synthetase